MSAVLAPAAACDSLVWPLPCTAPARPPARRPLVLPALPATCPRVPYLTEASVSLLVGLAAGGGYAAYFWARGLPLPLAHLTLDTAFFFDVLLPPILFQAGFSVKKKACGQRGCRAAGRGRRRPGWSWQAGSVRPIAMLTSTRPRRPAALTPPHRPRRPSSATSRC